MENTIEITVFIIIYQASAEYCLTMLMDMDWPYQN